MATVYLAQDLKHDRRVALKVLRPDLAAVIGGERFLQEIRTTANLQHPHILPLHDSGQVDGTVFYVMPFVEGESLRDRLNREKQLPVDDAVRIAREVASALDYAHRRGVIHRDIKPENILLHDGSAVVADFGIALAASKTGGSRMTETGMSLGTPTYMSPEQAMGERDLTARSDVYALGCVLHEMLTGEPPFDGPTPQSIVAKILTDEPRPVSQLRRTVPPHVEGAILTALEKVPADRFATAAELAQAIGNPAFTRATPTRAMPAAFRGRVPVLRDTRTWVTVAALALALALLLARPRGTADLIGPTVTTLLPVGEKWHGNGNGLALSPDGRRLAIVRAGRNAPILIRSLDSLGTTPLRGTDDGYYPFWSPDGTSLGFFAQNQLKIIELATGSVRTLCPAVDPRGGAWGKEGDILYAPARDLPLHRTVATGGPCTAMRQIRGRPYFFPDGRHFLLTTDRVALLGRLGEDSATKLTDLTAAQAVLAPPSHLLMVIEGELYAQAIDLAARRLTGTAVRVLDAIRRPGGSTVLTASESGTLVALGPGTSSERAIVLISRRSGAVERIPLEINAWMLRPSRDGKRLALGGWGLWIYDLTRRSLRRAPAELDTGRTVMGTPIWAPDDSVLVFRRAYRDFGYTLYDTRTEQPRRWFDDGRTPVLSTPSDWSPSGRHVLIETGVREQAPHTEIWLRDLQDSIPTRLIAERGDVGDARFSPNGRWIAYRSSAGGVQDIYLRPFPGPGPARQVSTAGGTTPRWRADGGELFYVAGGTIMAAPVGPDGTPGRPVPALTGAPGPAIGNDLEVLPDGRFVALLTTETGEGFTLIQNWRALLRRGRP